MSIMQPSGSWVARYMTKSTMLPGVYAMHLENRIDEEDDQDMVTP